MEALVAAEFQATMLASTGGFLREGNSTILIGTDEHSVDGALAVIQKTCRVREQLVSPLPPVVEPVDSYISYPVKVQVGGRDRVRARRRPPRQDLTGSECLSAT